MNPPAYQKAIKRCIDVILALILIIITVPVFILIAIAIKADSPGPVFFKQMRVGFRQRWFEFYKFRSMVVGDHDNIHKEFVVELMTKNKTGQDRTNFFKMTSDQRITRVGRILRKFSLDELPQIWNVLRGDMSMIGPRPAIEYELQYHDENMLRRFNVMPGITGYWQVKSRYSVDYREMVALDLYYVDHWSLGLDFIILLKTIPTVLKINQSF